ncbi:MBL fold metallo-hydrolase [Microbacterium sp. PRF11]|uniref:MBL fold metallo-hydrolase n=1 Tax=Microbacterium sp. PRF11 TaxID=2962593 RepID=UPI0028811BFC|nr:MBL fold metallo-hydrolase [Microbacterium sp. PRF11]MDT0117828.1 MBL fold metallo-hydrolase [Microbacterium sp. PRF11]
MRLTKHEHATLVLSESGRTLVIDPGSFTSPLDDLDGLVGVVITHEHPDHWTPEHLTRLQKAHPGVPIYGPEGVRNAAAGFEVTVVAPGDTLDLGPFHLVFSGGTHAVIHESIPVVDNVGVLINDSVYYPGDSYTVPKHAKVSLLAAPVGAPWLKIGDAIDYVLAVKPERVFATHDMTLSVAGKQMGDSRLTWAVEQNGGSFVDLKPGDSIEV